MSPNAVILRHELANPRPLIPYEFEPSDDVAEVLKTCEVIADADPASLCSYVISMARQPSDILAVICYKRRAGSLNPFPSCHYLRRLTI